MPQIISNTIIPSLPYLVQCQPHSKHLEFAVVIIMNESMKNKTIRREYKKSIKMKSAEKCKKEGRGEERRRRNLNERQVKDYPPVFVK